MTIEQIQYFLELSRTLNFTEAANNLFITQPSFSKQIRKLEEELGVDLVRRSTKKVELTQAGEIFQKEFSRIASEMDAAVRQVKNAGKKYFRIAVFQPFAGSQALTGLFATLSQELPDYEIHIHLLKHREIISAYNQYSEDIFIAPGNYGSLLKDCRSVPIANLSMAIVCSEKFLRKDEITFEKLNGHKLVMLEKQYFHGEETELLGWLRQQGCVPSEIISTGDIVSTIRFLEPTDSFGFIYMPEDAGKRDADLQFLEIKNFGFAPHLSVFWHGNHALPLEQMIHSFLE